MASGRDPYISQVPESQLALPPFQQLMLRISKGLSDDNFTEIKKICVQRTRDSTLEGEEDAYHLFQALMARGVLSDTRPDFLRDVLSSVARSDLNEWIDRFYFLNSPSHPTVSGLYGVRWLIGYLQYVYMVYFTKYKPLAWRDDVYLDMMEHYSPLQIMFIDQRGWENSREVPYHKLDDAPQIFGPTISGYKSRIVKLAGFPFSGKSMFLRKMAYNWACGKIPDYTFVFLLQLKDITTTVSIPDIIFEQLMPSDARITRQDLFNVIHANENNVLFLMDGINEVEKSELDKTHVAKILNRRLFTATTAIITTRVHERDRALRETDSHYRILGFTRESCIDCVDSFFKHDAQLCAKFKAAMRRINAFLGNETRILRCPLYAHILCMLWVDHQKGGRFPITLTDTYTEILDGILKWYCAKAHIQLIGGEVPAEVKATVKSKIAELAYSNYIEGKTMYEVKNVQPEWLMDIGLLVRDPGLARTNPLRLCYLSLETWVEYFTALHMVRCIKDGTSSMDQFQMFFDDIPKHNQILLYAIGLLQHEAGVVFEALGKSLVQSFAGKSGSDGPEISHLTSILLNLLCECVDYKPYLKFFQPCLTNIHHITWRLPPHGYNFSLEAKTSENGIVCNLLYETPLRVLISLLEFDQAMVGSDPAFRRGLTIDVDGLESEDLFHLVRALETNTLKLGSLTLIGSLMKSSVKLESLRGALCRTQSLEDLRINLIVDRVTEVIKREDVDAILGRYQSFMKSLSQNPHIDFLSVKLYFPEFTHYACSQIFVNDVQTAVFEAGKDEGPEHIDYQCWGFNSSGLNKIADFIQNCQKTTSLKCCVGFADDVDCDSLSYKSLRNALLQPSQSLTSLTLEVANSDGSICSSIMEDIMKILETNSTLLCLDVCLCAENMSSLGDLLVNNKHLKSVTCLVPVDTLENENPYSTFSCLPVALSKNNTLEDFGLKMCRSAMLQFHTKSEQAPYQDIIVSFSKAVLTNMLLPLCGMMTEGSIVLKYARYSFPDEKSERYDFFASSLDQVSENMMSYEVGVYSKPGPAVISPIQSDRLHEITLMA